MRTIYGLANIFLNIYYCISITIKLTLHCTLHNPISQKISLLEWDDHAPLPSRVLLRGGRGGDGNTTIGDVGGRARDHGDTVDDRANTST